MPIELAWVGGVLVAGIGTLVLAIFQNDAPVTARTETRRK